MGGLAPRMKAAEERLIRESYRRQTKLAGLVMETVETKKLGWLERDLMAARRAFGETGLGSRGRRAPSSVAEPIVTVALLLRWRVRNETTRTSPRDMHSAPPTSHCRLVTIPREWRLKPIEQGRREQPRNA